MNLKRLVILFLIGVLLAQSSAVAAERDEPSVVEPICSTDFESPDALGLYEQLKRHKRVEVVDGEGVDDSNALKATYRGYERGSERITRTFKLAQPLDEATLVFDVKFAKGFQFVNSGKLHGLGPSKHITGGREVTPDGWSARAVWKSNRLKSYVYCQDKDHKYGQGPDRHHDFRFKKERYYSVSIHVKLNDDVKIANGSMKIYVNGRVVAMDDDIRFRAEDGDHTKITHLLFSTFHGGHSEDHAPKNKDGKFIDVYAYFDNFAVYEGLHVRKKPGKP